MTPLTATERRLLWPALSVILPYLFVIAAVMAGCLHEKPAHAAEGYATHYTVASCQGEGTSGLFTANGEAYNEGAMTCALPPQFGREYMVVNKETGAFAVVRHNDTGPGRGPRKKGVVIDLSPAAFKAVCGDLALGKCPVAYQEVRG